VTVTTAMLKLLLRSVVLLALLVSTSCATLWTREPQGVDASGRAPPYGHGLDHAAYRGVIFDAKQIGRAAPLTFLYLLDLPLSLIGDTLCLPYDIFEWALRE